MKTKIGKIAPYAILGLALLLLISLNLFYQDHWLDSDMAAEMIFSKLLTEDGHIVATKDWYYSTEFRVLYTQLLMGPLFRVTGSWHVIRVITNLVFYGLMLGSYYYFVKPFKLSRPLVVSTSVVLLLPFSETMMTHMQMGNTYMSHVIIAFLFFGMFLRLAGKVEYKPLYRWGTGICFATLSFVCGVSGVRYLLALQVPLVLAAALYLMKSQEFQSFRRNMDPEIGRSLLSCDEVRYMGLSLLAAAVSVAGYGLNVLWVSKNYVFQTYGATNFIAIYQGVLFDRLQNMLGSLLMLFGYIPDRGFLSLRGLISLTAFVLLAVFIYCAVKGLRQSRGARCFASIFLAVAFCLNVFVFVFTTSTMVPRYYITILIFALPVLAFYMESEKLKLDRAAVGVILIGCLLLGTAKTVASFVTVDKNEDKRAVAAFLEQNGYTFGFATYTNGNIITELTEGAVEIANVGDPQYLDFFRWSSPVRYYEEGYHRGETFLLLTAGEMTEFAETAAVNEGAEVYDDGFYTVLVYESVEKLLDCAEER